LVVPVSPYPLQVVSAAGLDEALVFREALPHSGARHPRAAVEPVDFDQPRHGAQFPAADGGRERDEVWIKTVPEEFGALASGGRFIEGRRGGRELIQADAERPAQVQKMLGLHAGDAVVGGLEPKGYGLPRDPRRHGDPAIVERMRLRNGADCFDMHYL